MDYSRWSNYHKHILPTSIRVPAWGATLLPYRWLLRENAFDIAAKLITSAAPMLRWLPLLTAWPNGSPHRSTGGKRAKSFRIGALG